MDERPVNGTVPTPNWPKGPRELWLEKEEAKRERRRARRAELRDPFAAMASRPWPPAWMAWPDPPTSA